MQNLNAAVRDLADYVNRRGPIDDQIKAARARNDAEGRRLATELAQQAPPPPPFDALLLADTGTQLAAIASLLPYYDVTSPPVRIMGPGPVGLAGGSRQRRRGARQRALRGTRPGGPRRLRCGLQRQIRQPRRGRWPTSPMTPPRSPGSTHAAGRRSRAGPDPAGGFHRQRRRARASPTGRCGAAWRCSSCRTAAPTIVDPAPQTLAGPSS